jgi:hypothetical protein
MSVIGSRTILGAALFTLALALVTPPSAAAQASDALRAAVVAPQQLGLTVEAALGEVLLFDYSVPGASGSYRMHVTLHPDEVSWTELRDGGRSETDPAQSVRLDDHRLMMNWFEESGQFVVLYVDLLAGQTTYCGLLRPGVDEAGVCYTGTIEIPD